MPEAVVAGLDGIGAGVNVNQAGEEELRRIVHVDEQRARGIVEVRAQRWFASVEELVRVEGIGSAEVADIRAQGLACASQRHPPGTPL